MNIVIPVAINMMYEGKSVLSFSNLKSTNGDTTLLSIMMNIVNEATETVKAAAICGRVAEFIPVSTSVSAMRNAIMVEESAIAPLRSIECDANFLPEFP